MSGTEPEAELEQRRTEDEEARPQHGCLIATAALAAGLAVIIIGTLLLLGSDDDDSGGDSLAFQLAVLDGEAPLNEDDESVDPYRDVLGRLDQRCTNEPAEVADTAVRASADLVEAGVDERLITILQSIEDAAGSDGDPVDCAELTQVVVADLEEPASDGQPAEPAG